MRERGSLREQLRERQYGRRGLKFRRVQVVGLL